MAAVPDIACQIEQIFRHHKTQLLQMQREARRAVARYQTNWNSRQQAVSTHEGICGELQSVRRQIFWSWGDEERAQLESRAARLEGQEHHARIRRDNAEDAYDASKQELDGLEREENELDALTASALRKVDVGVLADPSWLKKLAARAVNLVKITAASDILGAVGLLLTLPTEVLEVIHGILDRLLEVLTIVVVVLLVAAVVLAVIGSGGLALALLALLLPLLGKVALVLSAAKLAVGLELYRRGEHTLDELMWDALDMALAVASVKWGSKLDRLLSKLLKSPLAGKVAGEAVYTAVGTVANQFKPDGDTSRVSDDWTECSVLVLSNSQRDTSVDSDSLGGVRVPDFNLPSIALVMPAASDVEFDMGIGVDLTVPAEVYFGEFELTGVDFSDLATFVYDNPEAVPDLSNVTLTQLEPGFDWHFGFSPPDEMFADFDQAFEELKTLVVPCDLGSAESGSSA
ncbi:MAG: hypothetical protein OXH86_11835 [Acidimicrobiaceae bacterium]|nr:hypothetical protein [Acidimicrobiaceae bacterium]